MFKLLKKLFFISLIAGGVAMVVKKVTGDHEEDEWSEHYSRDHGAHEPAAPTSAPDDTNPSADTPT